MVNINTINLFSFVLLQIFHFNDSIWNYFLFFILGGLICGFFIFLFLNFNYGQIIKYNKRKHKQEIDEMYRELRRLEATSQLKVETQKNYQEKNSSVQPKDELNQNTQEFSTIEKYVISSPENDEVEQSFEWYYSIPELNGCFDVKNGLKIYQAGCYYKIEIDNTGQKGKLSFISGDYDLKAIQNIDYYLNPVCQIQNIELWKSAKRILMISQGTVYLNAESWKIDTNNKVKIRLV